MSELKVVETIVDGVKVLEITGKYEDVAAHVDTLINKPKSEDGKQEVYSTGWACIYLANYSHGAEAKVVYDPEYHVTNTGDRFKTKSTVRGHPVSVGLKIAAIMADYPPQGYGTWAHPQNLLKPNVIEVLVSRNKSCD